MDERALVEALSAAIGGAISCTVFYPLDVAKTRYQVCPTQNPYLRHSTLRVRRGGGVLLLASDAL